MSIDLTTPALLFPGVTLLLLAYTNRFLAIAALIRTLHAECRGKTDPLVFAQIATLRRRLRWIRNMQICGVTSLLLCTLSMLAVFVGAPRGGAALFGAALAAMTLSLAISLRELVDSVRALDLHLGDLEKGGTPTDPGA